MTNDEKHTNGILHSKDPADGPSAEDLVKRRQNSGEHTLSHLNWSDVERYSGHINRQKLENDLKLDAVAKYSNRLGLYTPQEVSEIVEATASIVEECCGVLQVDPSTFSLTTNHEAYMNEAGGHVKKDYDSEAPLMEISTRTMDNVIASLGSVGVERSNKIVALLVKKGLLASDEVEAFIAEMQEENALAYYVLLIAHEMYHVRQYIQDKRYFDKTSVTQEERDKTKERAYYGNQGEMSARGFALRFLREKIQMLENKSERTTFEQKLLEAMKSGARFATESVQKQAAYGVGKADSLQ